MNPAELSRRAQIRNLASEFGEHGITTSAPEFSQMTQKEALGLYQAGERERYACISLLMDPVIDNVSQNTDFYNSVEAKSLIEKCFGMRSSIFAMLHFVVSDEFESKTVEYVDKLEANKKTTNPTKEDQAFKRLEQWREFLETNVSPDNYSLLDQGPLVALKAGFVTAVAMSTGIIKIAFELSRKSGNPKIFNPEVITNTYNNSSSTALRIASLDRSIFLQNQESGTTGFLDPANYTLERYGNGFRVALKNEFELKLKSSPGITIQQLEDPKGCPALAAPNGTIIAKRVFDLLGPIAEDIYNYMFEPFSNEEIAMEEMERMIKDVTPTP